MGTQLAGAINANRKPIADFAIVLLAHPELHRQAAQALRRVAPRVTGQLLDALLDPTMDFVVRRRIPAILATTASQRAADGLLAGIRDERFEVRYACGRALLEMTQANTQLVIPRESIIANLNVDSPLMLYPIKDVVVFGGEHSSLGRTFEQAASHLGLSISPDPMPEEVIFVRSDQFPFVRQGIPAAFAIVGLESGDPEVDGATAARTWLATVYHTPKDDFSQTMDFETGTIYARVNFLAGYLVAQSSERPTWNDGDFFGTLFAGTQEARR